MRGGYDNFGTRFLRRIEFDDDLQTSTVTLSGRLSAPRGKGIFRVSKAQFILD